LSENSAKSAYDLIIISGVSGSGKSTALNAFEDMGYFCIDNLPAPLISSFIDFITSLPSQDKSRAEQSNQTSIANQYAGARGFALLVDCRDEDSCRVMLQAVKRLNSLGIRMLLLYFDCQDDVVLRRFRETRRPHPLMVVKKKSETIIDALKRERALLSDFREVAARVIDTSSFSPHELRSTLEAALGHEYNLEVSFLSFGFKYGLPQDADLVVDVRFLPNPHFVPDLRAQTGLEPSVRDYVFKFPETVDFVNRYRELLKFLLPRYQKEGKRHLVIAIGCTGGKHRSVAIAQTLSEQMQDKGLHIVLKHRDLGRISE